jgi:hypothetical protein
MKPTGPPGKNNVIPAIEPPVINPLVVSSPTFLKASSSDISPFLNLI